MTGLTELTVIMMVERLPQFATIYGFVGNLMEIYSVLIKACWLTTCIICPNIFSSNQNVRELSVRRVSKVGFASPKA